MPELPEVETTRLGISPHVLGQQVSRVVVRNPQLRWPIPENIEKNLAGSLLISLERRAKYLLFGLERGKLLVHQGMSGSLRVVGIKDLVKKHDHVDICFESGAILRYHDPRRFGAIVWTDEPVEEHTLLKGLGPEPLSNDFEGDLLYERSRGRKRVVKSFIMDSHIVVGVGNIYANEALFAAGIRPNKAAGKISKVAYRRLAEQIKKVLAHSIKQGGTTLRDFVGSDGNPGYFAQSLLVYGRAGYPCKNCGQPLKEMKIGQRATVYCRFCQK